MKILHTIKITLPELKEMSRKMFGNLVKAVVDIEKEVMALDADLHADLESHLLEQGSQQQHLWGINLYPDLLGDDMLEFDSMINLRPSQGNRSRGVEDKNTQQRIRIVVLKLITL